MAKNSTIILNREDVNNPLHPHLYESWLDTLGVNPEATEVCLQLSPLDENKKILSEAEKLEKIDGYVKEKMKLFGNSEDERGKAIIEVLQNVKYFLE